MRGHVGLPLNEDGIAFNNIVFKSKNKLNLTKYKEYFKNSNLILSHQRYITSGKNSIFTQPFNSREFIFAHNGVLNNYDYNKMSDTFNLFGAFIKVFKREQENNKNLYNQKSREQLIVMTIKRLFDAKSEGSYSIGLIDKTTNTLYYFKNDKTTINFYKNHKYIYITTSINNHVYLKLLNKNFLSLDVKDYAIYKIKPNELSVVEIAQIKEPKQNTSLWGWCNRYAKNESKNKDDYEKEYYTHQSFYNNYGGYFSY